MNLWNTFMNSLGAVLLCFVAPSEVRAADLKLWTTNYASKSQCARYSGTFGPENFNPTVVGHKWPNVKGGGTEFVDRNVRHLNSSIAGKGNDKKLAARLLTASRTKAFTKLNFEGPGGSSPAFVSAAIVKSTAYSVAYLRSRNAITAKELREIDMWVQKLLRNSKQKAHSMDHKVSNANALMMWGAAVGDSKAFNSGKNQFLNLLKKMRNNPFFLKDVRGNNEVMSHILHGAHFLRINGIGVFGKKIGKYNLHDAVSYHAKLVSSIGTKKVKTSTDSHEIGRSILKSQGWGTHLAWIPVYLSLFPKSGSYREVRALEAQLRKVDGRAHYGRSMSVHSSCMFGRH